MKFFANPFYDFSLIFYCKPHSCEKKRQTTEEEGQKTFWNPTSSQKKRCCEQNMKQDSIRPRKVCINSFFPASNAV